MQVNILQCCLTFSYSKWKPALATVLYFLLKLTEQYGERFMVTSRKGGFQKEGKENHSQCKCYFHLVCVHCYLSMAPNSKYVILNKRKPFINEMSFHVVKWTTLITNEVLYNCLKTEDISVDLNTKRYNLPKLQGLISLHLVKLLSCSHLYMGDLLFLLCAVALFWLLYDSLNFGIQHKDT